MNQLQVIQLLNTLSTPSFYGQAPVNTALPFIAIHTEQPDNFAADNGVYCEKWDFRLDLYTVEKDLETEATIKKLLNDNGIAWSKTEEYIDSESCWEVEFEFSVIGNEVLPASPDPEPEGGDGNGEA